MPIFKKRIPEQKNLLTLIQKEENVSQQNKGNDENLSENK